MSVILMPHGSVFVSHCNAIVNPINCVGTMGKGLALQFAHRYPDMLQSYKLAAQGGEVRIGEMWIWNEPEITIINFPTKIHWRDPSKLEWISAGLDDLRKYVILNKHSVCLPALGCGLGGLDFHDVRKLVIEKLDNLDAEIILHEPQ